MNVKVAGIRLAKRLADNDETQNCPFCNKTEWGEEYHEKQCPFYLACAIIEFENNLKTTVK